MAAFRLPSCRWPRLHLVEFTDLPGLPRPLRRWLGDYLRGIVTLTRLFEPAAPRIADLLHATGGDRVVDLCSGAGGPWPALARTVEASLGRPVRVLPHRPPPGCRHLGLARSVRLGRRLWSPRTRSRRRRPSDPPRGPDPLRRPAPPAPRGGPRRPRRRGQARRSAPRRRGGGPERAGVRRRPLLPSPRLGGDALPPAAVAPPPPLHVHPPARTPHGPLGWNRLGAPLLPARRVARTHRRARRPVRLERGAGSPLRASLDRSGGNASRPLRGPVMRPSVRPQPWLRRPFPPEVSASARGEARRRRPRARLRPSHQAPRRDRTPISRTVSSWRPARTCASTPTTR